MSKILLLGVGPLPHPSAERVHAPGLRLQAFLDRLVKGGHNILLGELCFAGQESVHAPTYGKSIFAHRRLESDPQKGAKQVSGWVRDFEPDAIVALTDVAALIAAQSDFAGPLYVDYNGHPMAERQQQGFAHGNDTALAAQWLHVLPALLRADHLSVCSASQRLALVGELGAAGRLNSRTCGQELVDVIPVTLPHRQPLQLRNAKYFQNSGIPADARIILSTGGFNTWMDEQMLFLGLEEAMRLDPTIHFVCTGGALEGHVTLTFERFRKRVSASPFIDRFHLLGWVALEQVLDAVQLAHVGVNCDLRSLEGELGMRNRTLDWLWAGMRVVSTALSDQIVHMADQGFIRRVETGDWQGLGRALAEEAALGRHADLERIQLSLRAAFQGDDEFAHFEQWVAKPTAAPDRTQGRVDNPLAMLHRQFLLEHSRQEEEVSVRRFARHTGKSMLGSRAFQWAARFSPRLREMAEGLSNL
jgi:hypothetical protein